MGKKKKIEPKEKKFKTQKFVRKLPSTKGKRRMSLHEDLLPLGHTNEITIDELAPFSEFLEDFDM
jgi:hypothetical protein